MREEILLIDDAATVHQLVKTQLGRRFNIHSTYDGKSGLIAAAKDKPDLILLDVGMPAIHGFEVCRRLKADRATRSIPVVFLTAARSVSDCIRGLEAGACDYITKPFRPAELQARVRAALRTHKELGEMTQKAMVDEMTGLFDRTYFETQLDIGLAAAGRTGKPLGCILVDIDQMHVVNGAFGRKLGDQMLYAVSQSLSQTARREDVLCRFGGDEFALLMPDASASALAVYAERIRLAVRSAAVCDAQWVIEVTASLGVSLSGLPNEIPLVSATQEALSQAKQAGGDCISFAGNVMGLRAAA